MGEEYLLAVQQLMAAPPLPPEGEAPRASPGHYHTLPEGPTSPGTDATEGSPTQRVRRGAAKIKNVGT